METIHGDWGTKTYLEYCRVQNKVKNMIAYFRKQKRNIKKNPKAF